MNAARYTFTFDSLSKGKLGLSAAYGAFLAEGAAFCLFRNGHHSPGNLVVTFNGSQATTVVWDEVDSQLDSTWADLKEAAEYGAYAVAIVVCLTLNDLPRVERCAQDGNGIDIWVTQNADDRGIFQRAARLEVSGILRDDENAINARLRQKLAQTEHSDSTGLPAYVAVVEFGSPEIRMQKRNGSGQG